MERRAFGNFSSLPSDPWTPTVVPKDKYSHLRPRRLYKEKHICINSSCSPSTFLPTGFISVTDFLWCDAPFAPVAFWPHSLLCADFPSQGCAIWQAQRWLCSHNHEKQNKTKTYYSFPPFAHLKLLSEQLFLLRKDLDFFSFFSIPVYIQYYSLLVSSV